MRIAKHAEMLLAIRRLQLQVLAITFNMVQWPQVLKSVRAA